MGTIEMPKTYGEQLNELEVGGSILIDLDKKTSWQTNVARLNGSTSKVFTIRTDRKTKEIRVWRLADTNEVAA